MAAACRIGAHLCMLLNDAASSFSAALPLFPVPLQTGYHYGIRGSSRLCLRYCEKQTLHSRHSKMHERHVRTYKTGKSQQSRGGASNLGASYLHPIMHPQRPNELQPQPADCDTFRLIQPSVVLMHRPMIGWGPTAPRKISIFGF